MARPKKNNADYFSHDAGMRNDEKIKALRRKFGLEGYAIWCMYLEKLTDAENFEISLDELEYELIAGDFEISPEKLQEITQYCIKIKLFSYENEILSSCGLKHRLQVVLDRRNTEKERFLRQKQKKKEVSASETTQSKVKESKVKIISKDIIKKEDKKEKIELQVSSLNFSKQFSETWFLYEKHRQQKRQSLTDIARERALKKCAAVGEKRAISVISESLSQGWTGLFFDKSPPLEQVKKQKREEYNF